jgi:hypothetical protein
MRAENNKHNESATSRLSHRFRFRRKELGIESRGDAKKSGGETWDLAV